MSDHLTGRPAPPGRSLLFIDIDGTLIDSFPGIRAGLIHALEVLGHPLPGEEFFSTIAGPPMEQTLASLGLNEQQVSQGFDAYIEFTHSGGWAMSEAYEGMVEFCTEARNAGFWLATASSKGEGFARLALEKFGLLEHFDFLGAAEEYGQRRSKEKVLEYVIKENSLGDRTQDILMVGDRFHDFSGAAAFGLASVAVTWGYGSEEERALADYRATTPAELKEIIHEWSTTY